MKSTLNHDFHEVLGNNTKGAVRKGAENLLKAGEPITSETIFPAARRVFRNQHSKVEEMVGNMVMERTVNPARHCRGTPQGRLKTASRCARSRCLAAPHPHSSTS
ncbi:unnamed protein product [Pylaiella littoralis]